MLARKRIVRELCYLCQNSNLATYARRQQLHLSSRTGRQKTIHDIPRKVEIEVAHKGRLANVVPPKRCIDVTHRVGSKFGGSHSLKWVDSPRTILLVKKANDPKTSQALSHIITFLQKEYPNLQLVIQTQTVDDILPPLREDLLVVDEATLAKSSNKIDLIVALGGDGTVLNIASMFSGSAVPPVLGISMGSLGFLMPFDFLDFENAFKNVIESSASLLLRMRLECSVHDAQGKRVRRFEHEGSQVLNEIHLHRGRHPHLTVIDTFVDGQHMTEAIADGLIISTPTGSTAYSLSAGGPIVHPSVPSLLLTPICPRSLSFRSVLLPSDVQIQLRISSKSRAPAELSLDGREIGVLEPQEYLCVSMSKYPVPCIVQDSKIISSNIPDSLLLGDEDGGKSESIGTATASTKEGSLATGRTSKRRHESDDILDGGWVQDINGMLSFNKAFVTKGMLRHVSEE